MKQHLLSFTAGVILTGFSITLLHNQLNASEDDTLFSTDFFSRLVFIGGPTTYAETTNNAGKLTFIQQTPKLHIGEEQVDSICWSSLGTEGTDDIMNLTLHVMLKKDISQQLASIYREIGSSQFRIEYRSFIVDTKSVEQENLATNSGDQNSQGNSAPQPDFSLNADHTSYKELFMIASSLDSGPKAPGFCPSSYVPEELPQIWKDLNSYYW